MEKNEVISKPNEKANPNKVEEMSWNIILKNKNKDV